MNIEIKKGASIMENQLKELEKIYDQMIHVNHDDNEDLDFRLSWSMTTVKIWNILKAFKE